MLRPHPTAFVIALFGFAQVSVAGDTAEVEPLESREQIEQALAEKIASLKPDLSSPDPNLEEGLRLYVDSHGIGSEALSEKSGGSAAALIARAAVLVHLGLEGTDELWKHWSPETEAAKGADGRSTVEHLAEVIDLQSTDPGVMLEGVAPAHWIYKPLRDEFLRLRKIAGSENFQPLPSPPEGKVIKSGEPYNGAGLLAERLEAGGYVVKGTAGEGQVYTAELAEGVRAFQEDQGLRVDGIIGPNTLRGLNRSAEDRLELVRLNMARARLLPNKLGERYVLVNLPSGQLFGFESGRKEIGMKVVFGGAGETATRIFADRMSHVVFRPYWRVPVSIARDEIVPKAKGDAGYLGRKGYEIVPDFAHEGSPIPASAGALGQVTSGDLHIRQRPGQNNALGLVKFLFPNDHAIYLHDTPDDHLFSRSRRDFSHGCVRIEDPPAFAEWVLGPQGWDATRVSEALDEGSDHWVEIKDPIPVYIVYFTALPHPAGAGQTGTTVRYYHDVYKRDPEATEAVIGSEEDDGGGTR